MKYSVMSKFIEHYTFLSKLSTVFQYACVHRLEHIFLKSGTVVLGQEFE